MKSRLQRLRLMPLLAAGICCCAGCQSAVRPQASPDAPAKAVLARAPERTKPQPLFNGADLAGWAISEKFCFERHGKVESREGALVLETGDPMTGVYWKDAFPTDNYEVQLDAARLSGSDFFCGMTFPVGDSFCTLILGGWGGMVVGLSNIDDMSAAENPTTYGQQFETGQWYHIRLRVSTNAIEAWIDGERVIRQPREGHRFEIWWEQEPARPFGINTWYTTGAIRNLMLYPTMEKTFELP